MRTPLTLVLLAVVQTVFGQLPDKNYLLGKFDPVTDKRFVKISSKYSNADGVMRTEAYQAFTKMADAAATEGIRLVIISSTRNFFSQKRIWENKWEGKTIVEGKDLTSVNDPLLRAKTILRYSSMPGTSRHHWGTDIDLNSLENAWFESGEGLKIYNWLQKNGAAYGFCQPYTTKANGRTGYEEEKWHWSYMPLAEEFLKQYQQLINPSDISGFDGAEVAEKIKIIAHYVLGVKCRN